MSIGRTHGNEPEDCGATSEAEIGSAILRRIELEELEQRLRVVHRKERRHLLWMVLGISPTAILPSLGLLLEGRIGLLLLLSGLVAVSQAYAWVKASREAERLEKVHRKLLEES
jgi:hypothetical protein